MLLLIFLLPLSQAGYFWPEQVRIAWTENEGEMRVSWVTYAEMKATVWYRPILCSSATGEWLEIEGQTKKWNQASWGILY